MSEFDKEDNDAPKRESFEDQIRRLLDADPFVPFTVVVASGDKYPVTSSHSLAIGETSMSSIWLPKRGQAYFRKSQIVSVEVGEAVF